VPQPDPQAVAWMTAEQNAPRQHEALIKRPLRLVTNGPGQELTVAAKVGKPTMTPESESDAGTDILTGGSPARGGGAPGLGIVATVTPGSGGTTSGAESVAPAPEGSEEKPAAQPDANAPAAAENSASGTAAAGTADAATKTDATPTAAGQAADAAKTDGATAQDATQNGTNGNDKKESTSKKKKGLRKIVPW
jgi:hypothetical protein